MLKSEMKNAEMPAMPVIAFYGESDGGCSPAPSQFKGLTKREEFAKAAMQGLCANPEFFNREELVEDVAISIADALLAALEEKT